MQLGYDWPGTGEGAASRMGEALWGMELSDLEGLHDLGGWTASPGRRQQLGLSLLFPFVKG